MPNEKSIEKPEVKPQPSSMEEALKAIKQESQPEPEAPVDAGEQQPETGEPQQQTAEGVVEAGEQQSELETGAAGDAGGSADNSEQYDYRAATQALIQSATQEAASAVNKMFRDNDIKPMKVQELYQRDEKEGTVGFVNPDTGQLFSGQDARKQAQDWVDMFNCQLQQAWNDEAIKLRNQYVNDMKPALELMDFAPRWDKMDQNTRDIMDELVAPYEISDSTGAHIGYSCDLARFADQAEKIAARFAKTGSVEPAAPTGPALDARTSGSSSSKKDDEPKDIAEAMALLQKQRGRK